VGVGAVIGRLDRWAGRFNRWFGSAAVATSAERSGSSGGPPQVEPTAVVAVIGEIDREREPGTDPDPDEPSRHIDRG
jgi:hypothetical protein